MSFLEGLRRALEDCMYLLLWSLKIVGRLEESLLWQPRVLII